MQPTKDDDPTPQASGDSDDPPDRSADGNGSEPTPWVQRATLLLLGAAAGWLLLTNPLSTNILHSKALAVGVVGGFAGGLVAGGIGLVTVPLLVLVLGLPIHLAVGTNLLQSVVTGFGGASQHTRMGNVDPALAKLLVLGAAVGAPLGALVSLRLSALTLAWIFSIVILLTAVRMLKEAVWPKGRDRSGSFHLGELLPKELQRASILLLATVTSESAARKVADAAADPIEGEHSGRRYRIDRVTPILLGAGVGFIAGLLGVTGGFLLTPLAATLLNLPTHLALGTSMVVLTGNSLFGSLTHLGAGNVLLPVAVFLGLGGFLGANLGSRLSNRLSERTLHGLFVVLLTVVGLKMLPVFPL